MEKEQKFIFVNYYCYDQVKEGEDPKKHDLFKNIELINIKSTRGPATERDKYKRVKVGFDATKKDFYWVIYALFNHENKNYHIKNDMKILSIMESENDAKLFLEQVRNRSSKEIMSKEEELVSIDLIYLPRIEDED